MRKDKRKLPLLIMILIISSLMLTSCAPSKEITSIEGADLVGGLEEREEARVQTVKDARKEQFDRYYRDTYYFEDFTEVEEKLNKEFIETFEYENGLLCELPLIFRAKFQFYKSSLKKYKDGEISVDDFLENPVEHIRAASMHMFYFMDTPAYEGRDITGESLDYYIELRDKIRDGGGIDSGTMFSFYDTRILDEISIDELEKNGEFETVDDLISHLNGYSSDVYIWNVGNHINNKEQYKAVINSLELKYGEEFEILKPIDVDNSTAQYLVAPKRDLSIKFRSDGYGRDSPEELNILKDKYLTVLAQKFLSDRVNGIIEKFGASDHIVQLSVPSASTLENRKRNKMPFKTGEIEDEVAFLENDYIGNFEMTLIYLKEPDEEINYKELLLITNEMRNTVRKEGSPIFIYFYEVNEGDKKIITKLFKEEVLTEYFFRQGTQSLGDIYANMYIMRADTEGFEYLDMYGKKIDGLMHIAGGTRALFPKATSNVEEHPDDYVEDFIRTFRIEQLFK